MPEFSRKFRLAVLVGVLVALATISMVADQRARRGGQRDLPPWAAPLLDAAVPVQRAMALPVDLLRDVWTDYVSLVDVREANDALRRELYRLQEENLQLREALLASDRLARIAEMRDEFEVPMLPSELVASDLSPWFRSVLLDRGESDGVRSGMPVVSEEGLVGLVTATSASAAKTMLLLDRQVAIDGTVQRSRTRGTLRGRGGEELEFEFVIRGADVAVGDVVITSGLDGVYPKGLRLGEVTALEPPGSKLLGTAVVTPSVDFGRLEQAFVMLRRGPTMELLYNETAP
ncbi:MAG: rod shape-determining protein MreC [Myxococcota bacterium]|nr:rod shape-determining protein MreC [Myxococcota bacterium]